MALQSIGSAAATSGISRLTTEYIYWNITSTNDLSGAVAEVAFMETGTGRPATGDWNAAEIVDTPGAAPATPPKKSVRLLVGPDDGGKDLSPTGTEEVIYDIWIRIASGVERIVRTAGTLKVR